MQLPSTNEYTVITHIQFEKSHASKPLAIYLFIAHPEICLRHIRTMHKWRICSVFVLQTDGAEQHVLFMTVYERVRRNELRVSL